MRTNVPFFLTPLPAFLSSPVPLLALLRHLDVTARDVVRSLMVGSSLRAADLCPSVLILLAGRLRRLPRAALRGGRGRGAHRRGDRQPPGLYSTNVNPVGTPGSVFIAVLNANIVWYSREWVDTCRRAKAALRPRRSGGMLPASN